MAEKAKGKSGSATRKKSTAKSTDAPKANSKTSSKTASKTTSKTSSKTSAKSTANNKNTNNKNTKGDYPKPKKISNEIKGIVLMSIGLFFALSFLTNATGAIGHFLKTICYGMLGMSISVSCIFIIVTGLMVFFDKYGSKNSLRMILLSLLILFTSILTTMIVGKTSVQGNTLAEMVTYLWNDGITSNGGGLIGGGAACILNTLIGPAGTWVLAVAAEIILIILLTEISIEKTVRTIADYFQRRREEYNDIAESEIEFELPEYSRQSEAVKTKLKRRRLDSANTNEAHDDLYSIDSLSDESPSCDTGKLPKAKKGLKEKFFDRYFDGDEDISDEVTDVPDDIAPAPVKKRFSFEEDIPQPDDLFGNDYDTIQSNITDTDSQNNNFDISDLPFELDNLKTGVLTELPDEDGTYHPPVENEEGTDYEPPSQAKLEDQADTMTKAAMDAGYDLDRAVVAGRRLAVENAEEQTPEAQIKQAIDEGKKAAPKNILYRLPTADLLAPPKPSKKSTAEVRAELEDKANRLLETLSSFKVDAKIVNITQGPTVTRFELQPGPGIKVSKITNLSDDIALSLAASGVRIEPVPGKSAIGIEIPNKTATPVPIREVILSDKFRRFDSKTAFALGKDISGNCVVADIADFPHGLIAGATGSGKSVCINSLILSILFKARPDEVKMIMVDPKMVELGVYNGIPHLLIPVVTDPKHAAGALNWAVGEMKNRYRLLNENKVRNLQGYNNLMDEIGEPEGKLPEIVIIIDELADLMMAAKSEVEGAINSLAALARAAGMYLIIATQRPSVNVVTGVIKNNIPTRIAFSVTSNVDSRTILDCSGAEKLLGKGDMLYSPRGAAKPLRIQGNFVSDDEREAVIDYIKSQYEADYDESIIENIEKEREQVAANIESEHDDNDEKERDKMFWEAAELVLENGQASVAMFQRKFKMGYQRAAKLIDQMEKYKVIGPYEGTKPRQVLITRQELNEMRMNNPD